jgi:hypothetical protein
MITKPPAGWERDEPAAISTVRAAAGIAQGGARIARRGGNIAVGLLCYGFAALWGFCALTAGAMGSLPSLIGIGAMAALAYWAGQRAFAKARAKY